MLPQRRILTFLFLISIVTYLDRVNISIASTSIEHEFNLNRLQLGTIFSAFVVGYMLFQIPGGWIGDRIGHKKWLTLALILWSVFTGMTAWAGSGFLKFFGGVVGAFWLMRFLVGAGEAGAYPCANGIIGDWFPVQDRALAAGIMFAGIGVGSASAPPIVAWIMVHFGWRSAFSVAALIGFILALFLHLKIPERPRDQRKAQQLSTDTKGLAAAHSLDESAVLRKERNTPWRLILGNSQVWILVVSIFFFGYITYVYYFWFYPYLVDIRKISLLRSSFFTAMPFLTMALTAPLGGWLSDQLIPRIGKVLARRRVAMTGLVAAGLLIPCGATIPGDALAVACLSLGAGSIYLAISAYFATALDIFPEYSATVSGTMNTGASLGGVIAPILTPWLANHFGWAYALSLAGIFSLIAALLWQFTGSPEPQGAVPLAESSK